MRIENIEDTKTILTEMEDLFTTIDVIKKELENEICVKEAEQTDYLHELELAKLNGIEIVQVAKALINTRKERSLFTATGTLCASALSVVMRTAIAVTGWSTFTEQKLFAICVITVKVSIMPLLAC